MKLICLTIASLIAAYAFANDISAMRAKVANPYAFSQDRTGYMSTTLSLIVYYQGKQEDSALYYIDLAIPSAEQIRFTDAQQDIDLAAGIFSVKGYFYHRMNNPLESIIWFNKSVDYYKACSNDNGLIEVLNNLAVQYKILGDYQKAISFQEEALATSQKMKDSTTIATSLHNLSAIFREHSDYGKALEFNEESLAIYRKIKDKRGEAMALNSLAGLQKIIGDTNQALVLYEKALSIRREINDLAGEAVLLNNIGVIYKQKMEFDLALNYFFRSMEISESTNQTTGKGHALLNIGETYFDLKDIEKALEYSRIGYEIGKSTQNAAILKKATLLLTEIYASKEQWKSAFLMQKEYMEIFQNMVNDQSLTSLQKASLKYAYEKDQVLQEKDAEQKRALIEERTFRDTLFNYFISGMVILLLILVVIIAHRLKIVRQKNKVIERQNAERKLLLQEVHHRVKNNFQIVSSLLRLQSYTIDNALLNKTIEEAVTRINAMAAVHDIIYRQEEFSNIQTSEYLVRLTETLQKTVADRNIEFEIDTDDSIKDIEILIHLGIVINELVINSIKYAFPKDHINPSISISLVKVNERFCLTYKDNGIGLTENIESTSFGMELIETIVEQIEGELHMESDHIWKTIIRITFDFVPKKSA